MTDEHLAEALTRHLETGKPLPDLGAPYDDLVAGLIAGTLFDEERQSAVEALAAHPELRRLVTELDRPAEGGVQGRRRSFPWGTAAAAAVLLALVGGSIYLARMDPSPRRFAREITEESLTLDVADLQREHPELFEEFAVLGASERGARSSTIERGGLVLQEPRGAVPDGRPLLRWKAPTGATLFRVTAIDAEGRELLSAEAEETTLAWPPEAAEVEPGAHVVWRVEADVPGQRLLGSQTFRRLTKADAARYEAGLLRIWEGAGRDERGRLIAAHWAIRSGLLHEARDHLEGAGTSRVAEETRGWLAEALDD